MIAIKETIEPSTVYPAQFKVTRSVDQNLSDDKLTVTAAAYVFDAYGNLLFCRNPNRGWELPGGHRKKGEAIVQTIEREVMEETSVAINNIQPMGHIRIEYLGSKPDKYPYPYPTRYVQIFKAKAKDVAVFVPFEDSLGRKFVSTDSLDQLNLVHSDELLWLPYALEI